MKKILLGITCVLFINFFLMGESIEKITVEGNKKVSKDTILFYMKSAENGLYSSSMLREDFKALWNTGFFENISIESEEGISGKIVKVIVKENLLIKSVTFKTGKKIKESEITDKLQQNNITLLAFSYYNPTKIKRVEKIIKDMLLEKGYNQGKVNIVTKEDKDQVDITVQVDQGPKTRIGEVEFPGLKGTGISPAFLRWGMKNNKAHNLLSVFSNKDVYNKEKIGEDLEEVKLRLQQKGYLEAKVENPTFSMVSKYTVFGKYQPMMKISIPIDVGPQYTLGNINIEGNKILKTQFLRDTLKLKTGKVYNIKKRNKMIEEILKVYRSLGYIYCNVAPLDDLDPVKKVADLTLRFSEGEVAYLGKLEFKGNTFTKDHVIRREWFLAEGERLNMGALEDCITRMKQLGLVTIEKMPEFKPDPKNPQKVDIIAEVKELNRQMINFNVGYSGYDGWFIALGYSTQNFMGMGETFSINLQNGTRSKQYSLSFTEPYLFNLPASLGLSIHKTSLEYPYLYTRKGEGFGLSTSFRFWRYYGASLGYDFENVEISDVNAQLDIINNPYYYMYYFEGKRKISSLTPTIYYSTVDSPIFPTSGTKYLVNYSYSGGFLGGDIDMHKLKVQFVKFIPLWKRKHTIGIQAVYQGLKGFGEKDIPIYEKFFLGGEQSIRGYDIYRIGPRTESGAVTGGTKAFFINLEYQVPITPQFSAALYYDMGNAYDKGVPISFKNFYSSTGLELKVFIPMLSVPFRLIFAYNSRLLFSTESHFAFRFAVGPSFN
ncbi:MAG TPA: outer membrane protein assembly factor BamA [Candidatus Deferrimicrobium sp.]|nr:outer membrane protein assembly factor BamA [Candidatus Deferrimicrobium sp.]